MMEVEEGKEKDRILVVGAGKSGVAAVSLLAGTGNDCILTDGNEKLKEEELRKQLPAEAAGIPIYIGKLPEEVLSGVKEAVFSPGVPLTVELADRLREKNIPIIGEIELAFRYERGRLLAITGTNGKTTTTSLTGAIMKKYSDRVFVVGNIGEPYTEKVSGSDPDSISVAEISSFQLETIKTFRPRISAILNVTPDHLNRHGSMEAYAAAKARIAENQKAEDVCVLNYENGYTKAIGEGEIGPRVVWFSSKRPLEEGFYLQDGKIFRASGGSSRALLNVRTDMNLVGVCNAENVMAAIAMADAFGVPMDLILEAVKEFRAVEHRIEYVATVKGVDYYNDSKATNPDAAIQGILAMDRPTVLIGGGYDKGVEFDLWIDAFGGKVKKLVLIGQTRELIAECARKHGFTDILMADSFEECLELCEKEASPGDAVLLSPACASWGMFNNYEERGRLFKEFVWKLNAQ